MPTPNEGESKDDFIERCMGDPEANEDFPDSDQRFAFCNSKWEERETQSRKDWMTENILDTPENGH